MLSINNLAIYINRGRLVWYVRIFASIGGYVFVNISFLNAGKPLIGVDGKRIELVIVNIAATTKLNGSEEKIKKTDTSSNVDEKYFFYNWRRKFGVLMIV